MESMKMYKLFICTLLLGLLISCGDDTKDPNQLFNLTITNAKKSFKVEDAVAISVSPKKDKTIESVAYTLNGEAVTLTNNELSLAGQRMGVHTLGATITSDGETYSLSKEFTITATQTPKLYTYKILESYPHDMGAYTQGLEFENDTLYESTGQKKKSTLRKTNYQTGEVLVNKKLGDQYFGEGLTILNDKIYQLTWQENTGFIYNLADMEETGTFVYNKSNEGWGLCNDGTTIYKSDGTQRIWTLNNNTLSEEDFIEIYTNQSKIDKVNELEWVEGMIYANIYQKDAIAMVNPASGAVEGVINMKGLQDEVTQHSQLDVLNGIAYKGELNILYVTGKNWDKLFKIEVVEK
ncbi:glutaminyl-peptide cyclotransferase [Aureisphaera galaxeae]|uniref:glutaminyl-peptide cyclotransferase n=1 Tax=Aureisphaera galaxeae TaxID=1538023 RepID=UPI0023501FFF|nr:glutaminyl-peptide cyclotransferase [Aureisphaera galaxeae]MDC8004920.1 glutaminyl-peptide cyclotransferase [Aureisphaera galaxeae]